MIGSSFGMSKLRDSATFDGRVIVKSKCSLLDNLASDWKEMLKSLIKDAKFCLSSKPDLSSLEKCQSKFIPSKSNLRRNLIEDEIKFCFRDEFLKRMFRSLRVFLVLTFPPIADNTFTPFWAACFSEVNAV